MSRRRDWIEIADALKRAREGHEPAEDADFGIDIAAHELAELFARHSSGFNVDLFLRNAGVAEGEQNGT